MTVRNRPAEYGVGHSEWRPGQLESVEQILGMDGGAAMVLSAPTGSGKTALARAVSSRQSVTALCRTKMLQQENYADTYQFDVLFGRGN